MDNFEEINKKLNEDPTPISFHDMGLVNMLFRNGNLYLRLTLWDYMDPYNMIKNDNDIALIDVVYKGINIKNLDLECDFEFIGSEVMDLNEENGIINLCLLDSNYKFNHYFDIEFTCKSYEWKVFKIVSKEEYRQYLIDVDNNVTYEIDIDKQHFKTVGPELGRFDDVD